jgi:hypothetical protein
MNSSFPPKPGGPWRDARYAGGAWLDWKRRQEEKKIRSQEPVEPSLRPSQRQVADRFAQVEAEAAKLRQEWAAGRMTDSQLMKRLAALMVQDAQGVWWAVGVQTGEWYRYDGREWVRATPPRLATAGAPQPTGSVAAALAVSPSSVVYLHGHRFVKEASWMSNRTAVPCQSAKVDVIEWRAAVVGAAFVSLAVHGYASLYLGARGGPLGMGKRKSVLAEPAAAGASLTGLEGGILGSLARGTGPKSAVDVVKELRKTGTFSHVMEELIAQGYYAEGRGKLAQLILGKKRVPDCPRILALQPQVESVKGMIQSFKQANSQVYDQLVKDIRTAYK